MSEVFDRPAKPSRTRRFILLSGLAILGLSGIAWLIMATVILPRARRKSNETHALKSLLAYADAQIAYYRNHQATHGGAGRFLDDISGFKGKLPDELIAAHGANGAPYHGYLFLEISEFDNGVPLNWTDDFAMCAIPARYGVTGRNTFMVATAGTVFAYDRGEERGFVKAYPVDPATIPIVFTDD